MINTAVPHLTKSEFVWSLAFMCGLVITLVIAWFIAWDDMRQ